MNEYLPAAVRSDDLLRDVLRGLIRDAGPTGLNIHEMSDSLYKVTDENVGGSPDAR
jgi:hypothetical protein